MLLSSESLSMARETDVKKPGFQESTVNLDDSSGVNKNLLDALKAPECAQNGGENASIDTVVTSGNDEVMQVEEFIPQPNGNDADTAGKLTKIEGFHILDNILETRLPVDTVISCCDGKIGAHRIVLAAVSPLMETLFREQKLSEVAVLILPDIKKGTMETLLHLAYTGKMIFSPDRQDEILSALEYLTFGSQVNLNMSVVTVKAPEPVRSAQPGSSRSAYSQYGGASSSSVTAKEEATDTEKLDNASVSQQGGINNARKRRLSGSGEGRGKKQQKKLKYDQEGNEVPIAIRSGISIGKDEARILRKKAHRKILRDGRNIIHPPRLVSDPETGTIKLNVRKMPLTSVRLRQLSDFVCIEFHQNQQLDWVPKPEILEHEKEKEKIPAESESLPIEDQPISTVLEDNFAGKHFSDTETQIIPDFLEETEADADTGANNISENPDSTGDGETEDRESGFAENDNELSDALHLDTDVNNLDSSEKILEQPSPVSVTCSDSNRMDLVLDKFHSGEDVDMDLDAGTMGDNFN